MGAKMLKKARKIGFKLSGEKGMSLIEVIIIIVILGIALLPLSHLSIGNLNSASIYLTATKATCYAEEIMENIIADYKSNDPYIGGYSNVIKNWGGVVTNPAPPAGMSGRVSISPETIFNGVRYSVVTVTVTANGIQDVNLTTWLVR